MAKTKVLMTGAAGYIASQMLPTFRERYDMTLVDTTQKNRQGEKIRDVVVLDLIDPDRNKYTQYFEGVHAVVHLGYKRRRGPNPMVMIRCIVPMTRTIRLRSCRIENGHV